jgi:hypothetical protein
MSKRFIITEEEKDNIKKLYDINEQSSDINKSAGFLASLLLKPNVTKNGDLNFNDSSSLPNKTTTDDEFYKSILKCIGAEPTKNNLMFMYAWRQAEGGKAKNNPFNTTQKWPSATNYNSVGVKNYQTVVDGIQATCKTLKNGEYEKIIQGFKNDVGLSSLTDAVTSSPWGTKDLLKRITKDYIAGITPKPQDIA